MTGRGRGGGATLSRGVVYKAAGGGGADDLAPDVKPSLSGQLNVGGKLSSLRR